MTRASIDSDKPPLGILPEWLWNEKYPDASPETAAERIAELEGAIARYEREYRSPPREWLYELARRRGQR